MFWPDLGELFVDSTLEQDPMYSVTVLPFESLISSPLGVTAEITPLPLVAFGAKHVKAPCLPDPFASEPILEVHTAENGSTDCNLTFPLALSPGAEPVP